MNIDNRQDLLDVRDLIAAIESDSLGAAGFSVVVALLDELRDNGGDHKWHGDWYPVTLIRDDYFVQYAKDLADDMSTSSIVTHWPYRHVDWEAAAEELQTDYTSVEYDGITYWYR